MTSLKCTIKKLQTIDDFLIALEKYHRIDETQDLEDREVTPCPKRDEYYRTVGEISTLAKELKLECLHNRYSHLYELLSSIYGYTS